MNKQELTGQRAIAIFLVAAVAFSPIFLSIFSKPLFLFGLPQLYVYIFVVWWLVVLAIGINVFRAKGDSGEVRPGSGDFAAGGPIPPEDGDR
jgi:TctA family transporter